MLVALARAGKRGKSSGGNPGLKLENQAVNYTPLLVAAVLELIACSLIFRHKKNKRNGIRSVVSKNSAPSPPSVTENDVHRIAENFLSTIAKEKATVEETRPALNAGERRIQEIKGDLWHVGRRSESGAVRFLVSQHGGRHAFASVNMKRAVRVSRKQAEQLRTLLGEIVLIPANAVARQYDKGRLQSAMVC